jgi:hypothetical protein
MFQRCLLPTSSGCETKRRYIPEDSKLNPRRCENLKSHKNWNFTSSDNWKQPTSVRFQVLTAASMKFKIVFWDVLPCKIILDRRFRGTCCFHQHVPLKRRSTIFYTEVYPRRKFWTYISLVNIHSFNSILPSSGLYDLGLMACSKSELYFSERFESVTFGWSPYMSDQPVTRYLATQNNTIQKRKTDIHASSGIRTHDPSNQATKTYVSDCSASRSGLYILEFVKYFSKPVRVAARSKVLAAWLLGSWVRILLEAWMFVLRFCLVMLRVGRGLCDGLITRPMEESYRVS